MSKSIKTLSFCFILIILISLLGCSKGEITTSAAKNNSSNNNSDSQKNKNEDSLDNQASNKDEKDLVNSTTTYGRRSGNIVKAYIGNVQGALLSGNQAKPYMGLFLERYIYDEAQKKVYLEFKLSNNSDKYLSASKYSDLNATLYTLEGQKVTTAHHGYNHQAVAPNSYIYFYYIYENVNDPLDYVIFNNSINPEFKVNLANTEYIEEISFSMPNHIDYNADLSDKFKSLSSLSENEEIDYIRYLDISKAQISYIDFNDNGIEMQITIIPDKYIPTNLINNNDIMYQIKTNAGEILPLTIQGIEGEIIDNQYPSSKPITIKLSSRTIFDKCNEIELNMIVPLNSEHSQGTNYFGISSLPLDLQNNLPLEEIVTNDYSMNYSPSKIQASVLKENILGSLMTFENENDWWLISNSQYINRLDVIESAKTDNGELIAKAYIEYTDDKGYKAKGTFDVISEFTNWNLQIKSVKGTNDFSFTSPYGENVPINIGTDNIKKALIGKDFSFGTLQSWKIEEGEIKQFEINEVKRNSLYLQTVVAHISLEADGKTLEGDLTIDFNFKNGWKIMEFSGMYYIRIENVEKNY